MFIEAGMFTAAVSVHHQSHHKLLMSTLSADRTTLHTSDNRTVLCSDTGRKLLTLFSLQEVVKLPLEFVRQLSIKVQHQRPGKTETYDIKQFLQMRRFKPLKCLKKV